MHVNSAEILSNANMIFGKIQKCALTNRGALEFHYARHKSGRTCI
jgi:hypothetical protein